MRINWWLGADFQISWACSSVYKICMHACTLVIWIWTEALGDNPVTTHASWTGLTFCKWNGLVCLANHNGCTCKLGNRPLSWALWRPYSLTKQGLKCFWFATVGSRLQWRDPWLMPAWGRNNESLQYYTHQWQKPGRGRRVTATVTGNRGVAE